MDRKNCNSLSIQIFTLKTCQCFKYPSSAGTKSGFQSGPETTLLGANPTLNILFSLKWIYSFDLIWFALRRHFNFGPLHRMLGWTVRLHKIFDFETWFGSLGVIHGLLWCNNQTKWGSNQGPRSWILSSDTSTSSRQFQSFNHLL